MSLIKPATIMGQEPVQEEKVTMSGMPDFSFTTDKAKIELDTDTMLADNKPKRGRPPKKKPVGNEVVVPAETDRPLTLMESNEPFRIMYAETDMLLKGAVAQIDNFQADIKEQLDIIKQSKTLKNKYNYITEMTGTAANLIGTKIGAIREMNKTITDANNLELRRMKELKIGLDEQDDDRRIMDLYNAFVSTPMGSYSQLGPSTTAINNSGIPGTTGGVIIAADQTGDAGYNNYVNNMTPAQNAMRYENNPNIETVVIYNRDTGQRYFDVIDKSTGQSVPNMPRPDAFLLEDISINVNMGVARHTQLDTTYRLVTIGSDNGAIMEY